MSRILLLAFLFLVLWQVNKQRCCARSNALGSPNDFTHTYVYDLVGNRLQKQVDGGSTTYYYYDPNTDELEQETTDSNSIYYYYNANGSLEDVLRDDDANSYYTYGYHNRMISAANDVTTVDYKYNAAGIRVDANNGGTHTEFLIDPYNHTGYAQVFKEKTTADPNYMVYIFGHDVVAQAATTSANTNYLLYDGHG